MPTNYTSPPTNRSTINSKPTNLFNQSTTTMLSRNKAPIDNVTSEKIGMQEKIQRRQASITGNTEKARQTKKKKCERETTLSLLRLTIKKIVNSDQICD